jgi:C2 domain
VLRAAGRQDPYAILQLGAQAARSTTHVDGGTKPVWGQTFRFNSALHESELHITVSTNLPSRGHRQQDGGLAGVYNARACLQMQPALNAASSDI